MKFGPQIYSYFATRYRKYLKNAIGRVMYINATFISFIVFEVIVCSIH